MRPSLLTAFWATLLAVIALLVPATAIGDPAPAESVRIGTTLPPGDAPAPAPAPEELETHAPPADAPRVETGLKLPAPPAGFNMHEGGWVRFAYEAGMRERVQPLIEHADQIRAELVAQFGRPVLSHVTVYVARTPMEMAAMAPEGAPFPKYAGGVAYSDIGLVLLTILPVDPRAHHDLMEVFRHELAHVALHDAVDGRPIPRWFNEGFAVFASGETSFTRIQTLMTATNSDQLLPLKRLERTFPADAMGVSIAYAQAADVVRFLLRDEDHERFVGMMSRIRKGQDFDSAMRDSYGIDMATLEYEWREDVARRFTFWPVLFSGSVVWAGVIGLFVWGWRRRRRRNRETLSRWEKEEAAEDQAISRRLREASVAGGRVHIVLARSEPRPLVEIKPPVEEGDVPRIEHDGRWHTLH
jgi:hypothetical protein